MRQQFYLLFAILLISRNEDDLQTIIFLIQKKTQKRKRIVELLVLSKSTCATRESKNKSKYHYLKCKEKPTNFLNLCF